jgi:lysophospholipase L1-like esterase
VVARVTSLDHRVVRRNEVRKEILLVPFSLILASAAAEGLLRLFPALLPLELRISLEDSPATRGVSHPYIGNLGAPNGVIRTRDFEIPYQTDGNGFRNADPWPATADIVAVGDSLTFGYGVERDESWPALLGQELPDAKILNLGLIGAGPQQYLRIYETFGVPLHPKVLLIGFLARNDFWDAEMFDTWLKSGVGGNYMVWRDFGRSETRSNMDDPLTELRRILRNESYLYSLLRYARKAYRSWRSGEPKALQLADGSRLQLSPSDLASKTVNAQPGNFVFELVLGALERMQAIAKHHGTCMVVVFQPSKEEVYLPLLDGTSPDAGAPLREALDARGIRYLDLLAAFRARAEVGAPLFFETDGHPNRQGYQLIAEEIGAYLKPNAARDSLASVCTLSGDGRPSLPEAAKDPTREM